MKAMFTPIVLLAGIVPFASYAAGAEKLKVEESVEIHAKADDVWNKISNFGDLGAWHPAVKTTQIVSGTNNHKGAVRLLTLQDDGTIKEKLEAYNPTKHSFGYTILEGVLPVSHYHSTVTVKALSDDTTTVTWSGEFKRKDTSDNPAAGQTDEDATKTITAVYKGGLDNLKKITETK